MGTVFRAHDPHTGREVAIKLMHNAEAAAPAVRARFINEARAAARLRHAGIVEAYGVGLDAAGPFVVMELVRGQSLDELGRDRALSGHHLAEIVRDVARAVHFGHEQGVIHRDLKPENVLIDELGRVRLTDFGLAYDVVAEDTLTRTGELLGTPSFMSPEQSSGERTRGRATDVWSIGAILYWGLAGRPPFEGGSPFEIIKRVLFDAPIPPRTLVPTIPVALERITLDCLEKEPEDRPASAAVVADALGRFTRGDVVAVRDRDGTRRGGGALRGPALVALLLIAAGLTFGAGLWVRRGRDGEETVAAHRADGASRGAGVPDQGDEGAPGASSESVEGGEVSTAANDAFEDGLAAADAGELERALAAFKRCVEIDPRHAAGWGNLGLARAKLNDVEGSLAAADRAIELAPRFVPARLHRGLLRWVEGDVEGALDDLDEAVRGAPDDIEILMRRAEVRAAAGDASGVTIDCTRVLDLDPLCVDALMRRADARRALGESARAREDVERVLSLDADHARAHFARGLLVADRDPVEALRSLDRTVELEPDWAEPWVVRGLVLQALGRSSGAAACAERSVVLAPNNPDALALRGSLRIEAGDVAGGRADLEAALRLGYSKAAELSAYLGELDRSGD